MAPAAAASGWFEGREHRLPIRVYYEDTDFSGLVYHASFVRFLERGRTDYLRLIDVNHRELFERSDPCAFALTALSLRFRKSARIDDILDVRTAYDAIRGPRLAISQRIERGGETIVDATVEAVCVGAGGSARRPPRDLVRKIDQRIAMTP